MNGRDHLGEAGIDGIMILKFFLKKIGCLAALCTHLAQYRGRRWVLVNKVWTLQYHTKWEVPSLPDRLSAYQEIFCFMQLVNMKNTTKYFKSVLSLLAFRICRLKAPALSKYPNVLSSHT